MFTCHPVQKVGYYLGDGQAPQPEYHRSAMSEWWVTPGEGSRAFNLDTGTPIDPDIFRALSDGKMPDGRSVATQGYARRFGYDLHFAPPKSVSLAAMLCSDADRAKVIKAHDKAVKRVLKYIFDNGLLHCRRGRAGTETEAASSYVVAIFTESTSRLNDPQLHSHCVIPNISTRKDGTIGALNNEQILQLQNLLGSLYNAELASHLQDAGFELVRRKRNFEIAGFPPEVISFFSKRRRSIEEALEKLGLNATLHRAAAEKEALWQRPGKESELTPSVLDPIWKQALDHLGFDIGTIRSGASPVRRDLVSASAAVETAFEKSAVLQRPKMAWAIAEAFQLSSSVDLIEAALKAVEGTLVEQVGPESRVANKQFFSASSIIEDELTLTRAAHEGKGLWQKSVDAFVATSISERPSLSEEQIVAVRHALNPDLISVVEGAAGSGKSFALGAAAEAARAAGLEVFAIGSSWAATKVLAADTQTPEAAAKALTGFLNRVATGKIPLGPNSVVILDEAGMVGTAQLAELVRATSSVSAKLILSGDTDQLKPIAAGAPMTLLTRVVGSSKMKQIRRQSVGWQRDASMLFARGDAPTAVAAYDIRGHITWAKSTDQALTELADRFVADYLYDEAIGIDPRCSSLAIGGWNDDVLELNRQIRIRLQAAEILSADEVNIPTARRANEDQRLQATSLSLAVGDRIAFGETVKTAHRSITNADAATVIGVTSTTLSLRFADGQTMTTQISDLVGFRQEGEPSYPVIKHVWAATAHFAQGMTVDRCYVLAARRMDREALYVAMTRHRHNAHLFVDTSRLAVRRRQENVFTKYLPGGEATAAHEQSAQAQLKELFLSEWSRPAEKLNASDFETDPLSWLLMRNARSEGTSAPNRMELRSRKTISESGQPEVLSERAGVPNVDYMTIKRDFMKRSGMEYLEPVNAWIRWVRARISALAKYLFDRSLKQDVDTEIIEQTKTGAARAVDAEEFISVSPHSDGQNEVDSIIQPN